MKLRWSKRAQKDMARLGDYIALDSPFYARQFIGRLGERIQNLLILPRGGRLVPEAERHDILEVIYQGYRIIYQLREVQDELVLITVVHSSQDLFNPKNQVWNKPIQ
jgi:toxin ParE1/3/4